MPGELSLPGVVLLAQLRLSQWRARCEMGLSAQLRLASCTLVDWHCLPSCAFAQVSIGSRLDTLGPAALSRRRRMSTR